MDLSFIALLLYKRRKFKECKEKCDQILEQDPSNQSCWLLKMKAVTAEVYVDHIDIDETSLADLVSDTPSMAVSNKPKTSLQQKPVTGKTTSFGLRSLQKTGRMATGYLRPDTHTRGGLKESLTTASKHTSRAVSRAVRLATASMMQGDGSLNLSRLDLGKYAQKHTINKHLFEYIFYAENDVKKAYELACLASKAREGDWWWKLQAAKCLNRQRQYREAIQQLQASIQDQPTIENYLYLSKVYLRLDQPQSALSCLNKALTTFPNAVSLLARIARLHEMLRDAQKSIQVYDKVLQQDYMDVEAMACIGTYNFYDEKPEIAAKYFQRLLQMGVDNAEVYNNLGLCCFQSQQLDVCLSCFFKALNVSNDDAITADVWYNIAHVSMCSGNIPLASHCYQLSLAYNDKHAESYNNLAVIEFNKDKLEMARGFLQSSFNSDDSIFEPHYNYALLSKKLKNIEAAHNSLRKSLEIYEDHPQSLELFKCISNLLLFN